MYFKRRLFLSYHYFRYVVNNKVNVWPVKGLDCNLVKSQGSFGNLVEPQGM